MMLVLTFFLARKVKKHQGLKRLFFVVDGYTTLPQKEKSSSNHPFSGANYLLFGCLSFLRKKGFQLVDMHGKQNSLPGFRSDSLASFG